MSTPRGVQEFYYSRDLPDKSVAIAHVSSPLSAPRDLTSINNIPYLPGSLNIWKSTTTLNNPADFTAPDYNESVIISGATLYFVENQYFEVTTHFATGTQIPLYFMHPLLEGVTGVKILDLNNNVVTDQPYELSGRGVYHDFDGKAYRIRFVDKFGYVQVQLLKYTPVLSEGVYSPSSAKYLFSGRYITLSTTSNVAIRFLKPASYQVYPPYGGVSNAPWFLRIGFSMKAVPPEWAKQLFQPYKPYLLGVWIPGKVLDTKIIEFERPYMFADPSHLPDILIFDKDNAIKYALEGTAAQRKGTVYNWRRQLFSADSIDFYKGRVEVAVTLDPTDIVFGFYPYRERDYILTDLDINPHTNPMVENRLVELYYKKDPLIPMKTVFYKVVDPSTNVVVSTNDTNPTITGIVFSYVSPGSTIGPKSLTLSDVRTRGGGLGTAFQTIPEAIHFWDLGYWDGKPWPVGGTLVVYLPLSILDTMTKQDVVARVSASLPMGTLPSIRFYDSQGNESLDKPSSNVITLPSAPTPLTIKILPGWVDSNWNTSNPGAFSIHPARDGHSIWQFQMFSMSGYKTNLDTHQQTITIDAATYPGTKPLGINDWFITEDGTYFLLEDSLDFVYLITCYNRNSRLLKFQPSGGRLVFVSSVGFDESSDNIFPLVPGTIPFSPNDWCMFKSNGKDYLALITLRGLGMIINLTDMSVVGYTTVTSYTNLFGDTGCFVDKRGDVTFMFTSDLVDSPAQTHFVKWHPADGTTIITAGAQILSGRPANGVDALLNTTEMTVPISPQGIDFVTYVPSTDSVILGNNNSWTGDMFIASLPNYVVTTTKLDDNQLFYSGTYDVPLSVMRMGAGANKYGLPYENQHLMVCGSMSFPNPASQLGGVVRVLDPTNLNEISTCNLTALLEDPATNCPQYIGVWDSATAYNTLDIVTGSNSINYIAAASSTNVDPTGSNWDSWSELLPPIQRANNTPPPSQLHPPFGAVVWLENRNQFAATYEFSGSAVFLISLPTTG